MRMKKRQAVALWHEFENARRARWQTIHEAMTETGLSRAVYYRLMHGQGIQPVSAAKMLAYIDQGKEEAS